MNYFSKYRGVIVVLVVLTVVSWALVGALYLTNFRLPSVEKIPVSKTSLNLNNLPSAKIIETQLPKLKDLAREYVQAYQKYRDDKGFTKDIPILIFDARSEKDYLQRHISKASLTPIDNLKLMANSSLLKDKTVIVVVENPLQESQVRNNLMNSGLKELIIWPTTILDTLSPDLIEEKVEM